MFFRQIDDELKLALSIPQYADELFELTDKNRVFLKQWLPWPDSVTKPSDTRDFIESQLAKFQRGEALCVTIFYQEKIAGVLGYNRIDKANTIGYVGYWLSEDCNGKGIMTRSVKDLIEIGFNYYALDRVDIRCAVENHKSRAIPERLGFKNEGTIRHDLKLPDRTVDHVVYGLLRQESEWYRR